MFLTFSVHFFGGQQAIGGSGKREGNAFALAIR